jgi:hypothetical protein
MEGRFDDAEALWEKVLALNDRSMPKIMFSFMTHIYSKHEMPEKVIKVCQTHGFSNESMSNQGQHITFLVSAGI